MKKTFKTVLVLSLSLAICSSCSKKDDSEPTTPSGMISGTIENYSSGTIDVLKYGISETSSVSTTGKFSLNLTIPTTLFKFDFDYDNNGVIVSDTTARGAGGEESDILAYKNNIEVGYIVKSNLGSNNQIGNLHCVYIYVTKSITIKGTGSYNDDNRTDTFDCTLTKGWNEISYKKSSGILNNHTYRINTLSTTIPTGLKWYYFPSSSSSVKQQKTNSVFKGILK